MRRILLATCSLAALGLAIFTTPGCGSDSDSEFDGGSSGTGGDGGCVGFTCPQPEGGPKPGCVGLDTRCGKGGYLTVLELPSRTMYESR